MNFKPRDLELADQESSIRGVILVYIEGRAGITERQRMPFEDRLSILEQKLEVTTNSDERIACRLARILGLIELQEVSMQRQGTLALVKMAKALTEPQIMIPGPGMVPGGPGGLVS